MKPTMRRYQYDSDYERIRDFLRDVFLKNDCWERSWQAYRFDYWRWHGVENMGHGRLERDVFIWETPDKNIAAVLNREAPGSVWLQVHPQHRTAELEKEMINVAAEHLTVPAADGLQRHHVWVDPDDNLRLGILKRLGYSESARVEYQRRRSMADSIPEVSVADGYTVRALGEENEVPSRSWASWRAFHPDEPDEAYQGWEWYHNIQRAPLYRRDLDIVAIAPDDEVAAFCTIWFDEITRTGAFEPVGTIPEHQRRGLARAVMTEGLKRLKRLGTQFAYVGSWNDATNALYGDTMGFNGFITLNAWEKRVPAATSD